jgi:hypothetical protein
MPSAPVCGKTACVSTFLSIWLEDETQIWLSVCSDVVRKVIPVKARLETASEVQ